MKKLLAGILICFVLFVVSLYAFIPNAISLKASIAVKATRPGLNRALLEKISIEKWWPGIAKNDSLILNGLTYNIHNGNITVLPIEISGGKINVSTALYFIPIITDSTQLEWIGSIATSLNPIKRLFAYIKAREINSNMANILKELENFYKLPENIYGFKINEASVVDSILIASSGTCNSYPTNEFIYGLIGKLEKYASEKSANLRGFPMLNIEQISSTNYLVKVALPVDKELESSGDILQKRMPGGGNILITEVKGGIETTSRAFDQIKKYADDYERNAPAIAFYSLITNRLKEKDSSNWITKIYFPVK